MPISPWRLLRGFTNSNPIMISGRRLLFTALALEGRVALRNEAASELEREGNVHRSRARENPKNRSSIGPTKQQEMCPPLDELLVRIALPILGKDELAR